MALVKTFSLDKCLFTWNGLDMNSGVSPDSVFTASREFDAVTASGNAAGDTALTRNVNKLGNVEFSLMRNSRVHGLLMAQAKLLEESVVDYYFNFTVIDPSSFVQVTAIDCWIKKIPDLDIGNESGEVTWMFGCAQLEEIAIPELTVV